METYYTKKEYNEMKSILNRKLKSAEKKIKSLEQKIHNLEHPLEVEEPTKEEYVNISNPEDNEIYDAPKKPSTPQEQMQMAIDSIEKRSKYGCSF